RQQTVKLGQEHNTRGLPQRFSILLSPCSVLVATYRISIWISGIFHYVAAVSFVSEFESLPLPELLDRAAAATPSAVLDTLKKPGLTLSDFANLISLEAGEHLEQLCRRSQQLTQQRFGKVIRLFAPLYLSNECINNCQYCGFSRDNPIIRVTLSVEEVQREGEALLAQGFRNLLLVSGEHPRFVSNGHLEQCVAALHEIVPSLSLEVGPMETEHYEPLVQ